MGRNVGPTLFAMLRRDRGLFALVGCLIMLLNVLQPLTAARAAGQGPDWVICTVHGAQKPLEAADLPSGWPQDCPICLAGHACVSPSLPARELIDFEPAYVPGALLAGPAWPTEAPRLSPSRPGDPPPAIRAPPLSA